MVMQRFFFFFFFFFGGGGGGVRGAFWDSASSELEHRRIADVFIANF